MATVTISELNTNLLNDEAQASPENVGKRKVESLKENQKTSEKMQRAGFLNLLLRKKILHKNQPDRRRE